MLICFIVLFVFVVVFLCGGLVIDRCFDLGDGGAESCTLNLSLCHFKGFFLGLLFDALTWLRLLHEFSCQILLGARKFELFLLLLLLSALLVTFIILFHDTTISLLLVSLCTDIDDLHVSKIVKNVLLVRGYHLEPIHCHADHFDSLLLRLLVMMYPALSTHLGVRLLHLAIQLEYGHLLGH